MGEAFFKLGDFTSSRPLTLVPACGECGLYKQCLSPKMKPTGSGRKSVLIVGEAPGAKEDEQGVQFVGKTGTKVRDLLRRIGVDPNRDCTFTNALICRPPKNEIPEAKHTKMVNACRPNLLNTLENVKPNVVLLLGRTAIKSLLGYVLKESSGGVEEWAGWQIPCQKPNAWVCPTWHPSFIERADDKVLERMWESHIEQAFTLEGKPWKNTPDYESKIQVILDPEEAAEKIARLGKITEGISFDYETNMLKPDSPKARILCCAVCFDGTTTLSFPWHGNARRETLRILANPKIWKLGWNAKFEARWTQVLCEVEVKNWKWDGMISSHVLDNRPNITGLKFQAFIRYGVAGYEHILRPYMRAEGGNSENRLKNVSLERLLLYCGLDALLEWKVCHQQMKELRNG